MNFNEFVNKTFTPDNHKLGAFEASKMAWDARKEEVIKILNSQIDPVPLDVFIAVKKL